MGLIVLYWNTMKRMVTILKGVSWRRKTRTLARMKYRSNPKVPRLGEPAISRLVALYTTFACCRAYISRSHS